MGESDGPSEGTRVVYQGIDELLKQQNNIPNGETLLLFRIGPSFSSLCAIFFLTPSICVEQVSLFIKGNPKNMGVIDRLD